MSYEKISKYTKLTELLLSLNFGLVNDFKIMTFGARKHLVLLIYAISQRPNYPSPGRDTEVF